MTMMTMVDERTRSTILAIERGYFTDGSPDYYEHALDEEAMMTVPGRGPLSKRMCIAAAEHGSPWAAHEIDHERWVQISDDVVAFSYHLRAWREGEPIFRAWITSLYRRSRFSWRLLVYQQSLDEPLAVDA